MTPDIGDSLKPYYRVIADLVSGKLGLPSPKV
jgi:hypothetical protein